MNVVSVWYDLFDECKMVITSFDKTSSLGGGTTKQGLQEDISMEVLGLVRRIRNFRRTSPSGSPWAGTMKQGPQVDIALWKFLGGVFW